MRVLADKAAGRVLRKAILSSTDLRAEHHPQRPNAILDLGIDVERAGARSGQGRHGAEARGEGSRRHVARGARPHERGQRGGHDLAELLNQAGWRRGSDARDRRHVKRGDTRTRQRLEPKWPRH